MLDEAERTGWMHSDFIGFDSLEDLLNNSIDPDSMGIGEVSDWKFVVQQMIPAARNFGVEPEQLFAASCQIKKLRGSVPTARQIIKDLEMGDITEKEAADSFKNVVEWVADPKVTFSQFETNIGKREPVEIKRIIDLYDVSIPGGEHWLVIKTETETERVIVEKILKKRIRSKPRALPWLIEQINETLGRGKNDNPDIT
jgi:hypothetical protein